MVYRKEIDSLRTLAVLAVIFYHAGFDTFSGGYVGVDIFFVISGYLITGNIILDIHHQRFSLLEFYERRIRRIVPALTLVMLLTAPLAAVFLYPKGLKDYSESLMSVAGFYSNIFFWRTTSYFDVAAELKPLLHTWSLAVEEQYYLVIPLLILWIGKKGHKVLLSVMVVIFLASLFLADWSSRNAPTSNYYLITSRFWELLVGSFVAYFLYLKPDIRNSKYWISQCLPVVGLAMVFASVFLYNETTPIPGLYALLPILGTALFIVTCSDQSCVSRWICHPWIVLLGGMSYSLYLWHQPLFAFQRYISTEPSSWATSWGLIFLTIVLAYLTRQYVENYFLRLKVKRSMVFLGGALSMLMLAGLGLILPSWGLKTQMTSEQLAIYRYVYHTFADEAKNAQCEADQCSKLLPPDKKIMVWGDSHATALSVGFQRLHPDITSFTLSSCPPFIGMKFLSFKACRTMNREAVEWIGAQKPDYVVLQAYWFSYGEKSALIQTSIQAIHAASPSTQIVLVGTVPIWHGGLPTLMLKHAQKLEEGVELPVSMLPSLRALDVRLQEYTANENVVFFSALNVFCKSLTCLATTKTKAGQVVPTAFDYGHLTAGGAEFLTSRLLTHLNNAPASNQ